MFSAHTDLSQSVPNDLIQTVAIFRHCLWSSSRRVRGLLVDSSPTHHGRTSIFMDDVQALSRENSQRSLSVGLVGLGCNQDERLDTEIQGQSDTETSVAEYSGGREARTICCQSATLAIHRCNRSSNQEGIGEGSWQPNLRWKVCRRPGLFGGSGRKRGRRSL